MSVTANCARFLTYLLFCVENDVIDSMGRTSGPPKIFGVPPWPIYVIVHSMFCSNLQKKNNNFIRRFWEDNYWSVGSRLFFGSPCTYGVIQTVLSRSRSNIISLLQTTKKNGTRMVGHRWRLYWLNEGTAKYNVRIAPLNLRLFTRYDF